MREAFCLSCENRHQSASCTIDYDEGVPEYRLGWLLVFGPAVLCAGGALRTRRRYAALFVLAIVCAGFGVAGSMLTLDFDTFLTGTKRIYHWSSYLRGALAAAIVLGCIAWLLGTRRDPHRDLDAM